MRNIRLSVSLLSLVAAILFVPCSSFAQTIDYGSLQSLFGESVTTAATGTPQIARDVAANMTIITADQIRQSGSRSIPEIISRVPGLDILRSAEYTHDVGVRGYQRAYQPRLLVLVDGRQVFIDDYSRTLWENIPVNVDDIRQIEIVKGASSALFGSNATGGVVNIITYSPLYDNNNVVTGSIGSQRNLIGDVTSTTKFGDLGGLKLTAGGFDAEEFDTPRSIENKLISNNPSKYYAVASAVVQLSPDFQSSGELTYSKSDAIGADHINILERMEAETYSAKGGFAWQTPFGLIKNNNYFNHTKINNKAPNSMDSSWMIIGDSTDLIVSQLEDEFKIGADHTFRTALEYRHKTFNVDMPSVAVNPQKPRTEEDVYSIGGTWLWNIDDQWSWTNAFRYDHQDQEQTGTIGPAALVSLSDYSHSLNMLSVNSGLIYKATDKDTFRATYGRGIQIPSLIQVGWIADIASAGTVLSSEGNPDLKPTVVQNYELGYDRKLPEIFSTGRVSAYYQINQDLTAFSPNWSTRSFSGETFMLIQNINVGNSQGWGGEIQMFGENPSGFRWDGSYSYSRVADGNLVKTQINFEKSAPTHHFRLSAGYTNGNWEFDTKSDYVTQTSMSGPGKTPTAGYYSLGGRIGYKISDTFTASLSGTNLTQSTTNISTYPQVERQYFLTLTGKF
ncbi:MAG: TonB-dependent receptor [Bdellovibrionales bacterium]